MWEYPLGKGKIYKYVIKTIFLDERVSKCIFAKKIKKNNIYMIEYICLEIYKYTNIWKYFFKKSRNLRNEFTHIVAVLKSK